MAKRKIVFDEKQIAEINQARKNNKNKNTERRLTVLSMKAEGKTIEDIALRTGYNPTYARSLVTKYFAQGLDAITSSKHTSNYRNMTLSEEAAFVEGFIEDAKKGKLTTVKDIKAAYEDRIGRKLKSKGHIYSILNRHGWRKIKPRPAHPKKASEAEIEVSKKLTLASPI